MSDETTYELSEDTLKLLKKRKPKDGVGCFMCKLIVLDYAKNKSLTDYPRNFSGEGQFPVESKLKHIALEKEQAVVAKPKRMVKKKEGPKV